jgi:adhesin transport system membrane fusion protein
MSSVSRSGRLRVDDRPPRSWGYVIALTAIFIVLVLLWASWAQVDEISRAEGKVIPSGKTQIIQSAEAGVVTEILVRAGERVSTGQQLIRLDDTTTASSAGEVEAKVLALGAQVARLELEGAGRPPGDYTCPADVQASAPEICSNETQLMVTRAAGLEQSKQVLTQRVEQRQRELGEAQANQDRLQRGVELANERLDLMKPLAAKGLVAQTEFLSVQTEVNDLNGQRDAISETIARLGAAVEEARLQVSQADLQFRQDALAEMTLRKAELASGSEQLRGAADRVSRTDIRSPVDGVVNNIDVTTIGAVVAPGTKLLDIVPVSDKLVVEARLKPSDVGFVVPGQKAQIKVTAYDFSIYGGLEGTVTNVSADSIVDPELRETYYLVQIESPRSVMVHNGEELPILPGMVTSVDILTGSKSILSYLLKPIVKAQQEALRER